MNLLNNQAGEGGTSFKWHGSDVEGRDMGRESENNINNLSFSLFQCAEQSLYSTGIQVSSCLCTSRYRMTKDW